MMDWIIPAGLAHHFLPLLCSPLPVLIGQLEEVADRGRPPTSPVCSSCVDGPTLRALSGTEVCVGHQQSQSG